MNTDTYTIRFATIDDLELIRTLGLKTFTDTFAQHNTAEDMKLYVDKAFDPKQVQEELLDKSTTFILLQDDSNVAGYAKIRVSGCPDGLTANSPIEIERIYAVKEYLGKAVGQKLMEACLSFAKEHQHDVVWLGVWEHNPRAIRFYEKYGFEKFGSHPFLLGTDLQTDLLMKKNLID